MIYKHSVETWFVGNSPLLTFYEVNYKNKTNGFAAPRSYVKKFNNLATRVDKERAIGALAETVIQSIVVSKNILRSVDFQWLLKETQEQLKLAVCAAIQHLVLNQNAWERVTGAGVSTGNMTLTQDTSGWVINSAIIGTEAWNYLLNAGLSKYKIVGDDFIGRLSTDQRIIFEWDRNELETNLGSFPTFVDGSGSTSPQRYDYFTVGEEVWRWSGKEWERVDVRVWEGRKYLVYEDFMLIGTKGKDGEPGKDGKDGKDFNVHGNAASIAEVLAKPNPQKDDVWIVGGDMIIYNGDKWINGGAIATATTKSQWRYVNKSGVPAMQTANGEIVLLEDLSGNPQVSDLDNAAASQGYVLKRTQANDYIKLFKIQPLVINSGNAAGGHLSYQEHYGSLDTDKERTNFMDNVVIGKWYTFSIGGDGFQALITSGTAATSYQWVGFKEFTGANGISVEFVKGQTTEIGNSVQAAPAVGEFFANTIAQVVSYGGLQFLPKDVIVQLIKDMLAPAITDGSDPTWQDIPGTQSTLFNASQITITLTNSGISANEDIQLILGSTAGDLVLAETIHVYPNVVEASQHGYVSGVYKWYMYVAGTDVKFVMEASDGSLTDTTQTLTKIRRVAPKVQPFTAHYTSQADILLNSTWIGDLAKGTSKIVTLPTGITTDNLTQLGLSVSGTTDWVTVSGWDKVTPFYTSVMTEDTGNTWWIEYKIEHVPGDKTKLKLTNFMSGNQNDKAQAYKAHWLHAKGGL